MAKMIMPFETLTPATISEFEQGDRVFMVMQYSERGHPCYMVLDAEYGVDDDGDGESGPMPYQYIKNFKELERGIGGSADPLETLKMALEHEAHDKAMEEMPDAVRG